MTYNVEKHIGQLRDLMRQYGLTQSKLVLVDDVAKWVKEHKITETNPFRAAVAVRRTASQIRDIVVLKEIPADEVESIKSAMKFRGFYGQTERLNDEWLFIKHLVLHEIAHCKDISDEKNADQWAFDNLNN